MFNSHDKTKGIFMLNSFYFYKDAGFFPWITGKASPLE